MYALNGDELLDIDLRALLRRHREAGTAATVAVALPRSPFAVVQLANGDLIAGFDERAAAPWWVSCGVYVLSERALERFPERGDHESSAFPQFAAEGDLAAFRHGGRWLTVNTPKDLRNAEEYLATHPGWPA